MKKIIFALLPALVLSCTGGYTITGTAPEGVDSVKLIITDTGEVVNEIVPVSADLKFEFSGKLSELSTARIFMMREQQRPLSTSFSMFNDNITVIEDTSARGGLSADGSVLGMRVEEIVKAIYSSDSDDSPYLVVDSLLSADPSDIVVPYLFHKLVYYFTLPQYDSIMAKIVPSLRDNIYFVSHSELFETLRKTDVGQPFTDFTCPTADGQPLQLSSIAGKGTWVLVDFWASWCGPCRRENPNVVAAYRKYHEKGFDILGVSLDDNGEKWAAAIEKDSLMWTHVSDLKSWDSPSRVSYGVMAIPSNVLIAPDGTIAARNLRGEDLEKFLSEKLQ